MKNQNGDGKRSPLYKSFGYAFAGIFHTIREERNIKIHLFAMLMVVLFGLWLGLSMTEWFVCLILFGLIISLELINTSLEAIVDLASPEFHPLAGKAKDAAAGAVLWSAIMAAVIGLLIFVPKLYALLG